jgi:hypothetical protein
VLFRLSGMTMLFLFASGLIYGRCVLSESRHAESLRVAAEAMDQAVTGDLSAWERAETAYGRAARASLLDSYPLWVLEVLTAWRTERSMASDPTLLQVLRSLRAGHYAKAQDDAAALPPSKGQEFVQRLVSDLRAAEAQRGTAN